MTKKIRKNILQAQLQNFYDIALEGIRKKTMGPSKFLALSTHLFERIEKSASIQQIRLTAPNGLYHKESLAVVAVDVRKSSQLAIANSAETMFKVFQCFLPLMAYITNECTGEVISLRGDGLISAFGYGSSNDQETVSMAYEAGMLMIQATQEVLNPFLSTKKINISLDVGTALDIGDVVFTKIGFKDAIEVTAYGPPVNSAAKNNIAVNALRLSRKAYQIHRGVPTSDEWSNIEPSHKRIVEEYSSF